MARASGRKYSRDARGRFASSGASGQSSGRGSRLRSPGKPQQNGSRIKLSRPAGTLSQAPIRRRVAGGAADRAFAKKMNALVGNKKQGRWAEARKRAKSASEGFALARKMFGRTAR
jgi:hypothetical protein